MNMTFPFDKSSDGFCLSFTDFYQEKRVLVGLYSEDEAEQLRELVTSNTLWSFKCDVVNIHDVVPDESTFTIDKENFTNPNESTASQTLVGKFTFQFGCLYKIERIYELTDEEMKKQNLFYRKRVTLKQVFGDNSGETTDFAIRPQEK